MKTFVKATPTERSYDVCVALGSSTSKQVVINKLEVGKIEVLAGTFSTQRKIALSDCGVKQQIAGWWSRGDAEREVRLFKKR